MRVGQNYELARGVADRAFLATDATPGRSVSASSGYGTREDSSSSEDIALRSLPLGASAMGTTPHPVEPDYPFNPHDLHFERNGNYYSTVKPLITVVKPQPGVKVRARIALPPSPTCEQDDNYNISKQPEYGKLEVNLGDMLERLQSDLVGLRSSLRTDMQDAEPLLTSSINTPTRGRRAKPIPDRDNYEELEVTSAKTRSRSDYSKLKTPLSFTQRLLQEFSGSGKHGMKTVLKPDANPCLRLFWIVLFVCCLGALCLQLWDRVALFTTNPTHVMVDKRYLEELPFPAVTICSLNMFRLTKIVDLNLYPVAHSLLHKDDSNWTARQLQGRRNLDTSYREFLHSVGHQKQDLIESCSWYGKECGPNNFTEIITDYGLCFVFHPTTDGGVVRRAGANAGLSLLLNVEHYEYLFGRKSSVGVRVSVHDSGVLPEVESKGVNVPVGSFTTLMIQKVTEHHRSSTLANCSPSSSKSYNRSVCLLQYEEDMVRKRCNCSTKPYQWNKGKLKICDAKDYFTCIVNVKAHLNENQRYVTCPPYCDFTEYDITLSEAGLPVYAAEGRLQRLNKGGVLERNFQQARDIYHRSDKVLLDHDIQTLDRILVGFNDTEMNISKMFAPLQEDSINYGNAFQELKGALEVLNSTTKLHYDAFLQSRHVDFCQDTVIKHIEDNMDDILQAESVIEDIRNLQFQTANDTLWKITRKVDRLVRKHEEWLSTKYSGFFVEVTNGIERFRDDLVIGYGQRYREFKESERFYANKVAVMLNLTGTIRDSLLDNYRLLSNVTQKFSPRLISGDRRKLASDLTSRLTTFFRDVKYLKENPLPQLFTEMKTLDSSYAKKRKTILELSDTLIKIEPYMKKIGNELDGFFRSVESTLSSLQSGIMSLSKTLADLAVRYKQNRFQKTELAEKINDDRLKTKISSAETFLLELRSTVSSLLETGGKIFELLDPIGHRLIDFEYLPPKEKNNLMSSLRFESLEQTVENLSQHVEEQLSTLNDLQTELDDYHRGSRLNGKFYLNNFLQLEVYFPELAETVITHEETYGLIALACDIGSSLALYLGISLLTVFGLLDLVVRTLLDSGGTSR